MIGTGFGTRVHVPGLRLAGVEVVAIASRRAARATAAAAALGIPAAFDDYRTMLASAQPDLVCVVTPPALHPEMVRAAVAGGAHVICEKPLAPFVLLARDVVARATGGAPPLAGVDLPTFADGARTQAVIDAVRGGAAGRRWLDVEREAPGGSEVRRG